MVLADTDWVAFIDEDIVPADDWYPALRRSIEEKAVDCIIGAIDYRVSSGYWGTSLWYAELGSVHPYMPKRPLTGGPSGNMAVRREAFSKAGGFPDDWRSSEELFAQARMITAGHKLIFDPAVIVYHYNLRGAGPVLRHLYLYGRFGARLRRAYPFLPGALAVRHPILSLGMWLARLGQMTKRVVVVRRLSQAALSASPPRNYCLPCDLESQLHAGSVPAGIRSAESVKLLIGIPTHKRPELLRLCLDSIAAQRGELPEIEVFIADNDPGGMQGLAVVEQLAVRFPYPLSGVAVAQPGISAVRNAILDEARRRKADFIAMIDDDVRADRWWLSKLFAKSAETGSDIFAGPVFFDFPEGTSDFLRTAFLGGSPLSGPIDLINGTTGVLIDAKTLDASGWPTFDPAFGLTGGGDKEWFSRLKGMGARFEWVSDAHVFETVPPSRANLKWFLKRRYRYGIDDIRIDRLHGTPASRFVLIAQALGLLALSPLLLPLLFTDRRYVWLGRFARALGRLCAPFGVKFHEYAVRHSGDAPNPIPNPRNVN